MALDDCRTCGDPQSRHKAGKGGCRHCEFGCAEYVPDVAAEPVEPVPAEEIAAAAESAEKERVLTAVAEVCEDQAEQARTELGQQSTSARLREVERERDEALAELTEMAARKTRMQRDLDAELGEAREQLATATVQARKVDPIKAELATAQQELTSLRTENSTLAGLNLEEQQLRQDLVGQLAQANEELLQCKLALASASEELGQARTSQTDSLTALLDRADGLPATATTASDIRGLFDLLRDQLDQHNHHESLRAEAARLEERLAEIDRELNPPHVDPALDDKTVRAWAATAGIQVSPRGRVADWMRDRYRQAHA